MRLLAPEPDPPGPRDIQRRPEDPQRDPRPRATTTALGVTVGHRQQPERVERDQARGHRVPALPARPERHRRTPQPFPVGVLRGAADRLQLLQQELGGGRGQGQAFPGDDDGHHGALRIVEDVGSGRGREYQRTATVAHMIMTRGGRRFSPRPDRHPGPGRLPSSPAHPGPATCPAQPAPSRPTSSANALSQRSRVQPGSCRRRAGNGSPR